MTVRKHHYELYGGDTETDHESDYSHAWIAQWSLVSRDVDHGDKEIIIHGRTLDELMERIRLFESRDGTKTYVYFHNLKYDFQFLRDELYLDYYHYEDSHIIANNGRVIAIKIGNLEIRDSSMKIPGKLKDIAPLFGLRKLEPPRDGFPSHWSDELTGDESEFLYVDMDSRIVYTAMKYLHSVGDNNMTQASDGFHEMRAIYNKENRSKGKTSAWLKHYPRLTYGMDDFLRKAYYGGVNLSFHKGYNVATEDRPIVHEDVNSEYPTVMFFDPLPYGEPIVIDTIEELQDYELYIVFAQFKLKLKKGMIPWFKPKNLVTAGILSGGIEHFVWDEPIIEMDDFQPMCLCSVDIMTLKQFYIVKMRAGQNFRAYGFKSEIGAHRIYLDKWYEAKAKAKADGNEVLKKRSKLKLNSCYGRFGMRVQPEEYGFEYDPLIDSQVVTKLKDCSLIDPSVQVDKPSYIPMAVFVCAWARHRLLQNVLRVGPMNVIHADTDSVIHFGPPSDFSHGPEMGAWKIEQMPLAIYEGGFKRYIEVLKPGTPVDATWFSMAGAGIPHDCKDYEIEYKGLHSVSVPIGMGIELYDVPERIYDDNLILGHEHYRIESQWLRELYEAVGLNPNDVNTMKLQQHNVHGGCVLMPTTFNIRNLINFR